MMYVALTYDHRLIDGREAVTFLRKIKQSIEDPASMFMEVWVIPSDAFDVLGFEILQINLQFI